MKTPFNKYMSLVLLLFLTAIKPLVAQQKPTPISIGISETFRSDVLNETRRINIYLPEDYNAKDSVQYPVIYVLDGGIEEDFFHITGIVRYNTQAWVARFPKSLVVGIENVNRKRDFSFAVENLNFLEKEGFKKESFPAYGGSEKYLNFLESELFPFMTKQYKANAERTIIGESMAGLLAAEILLKRPTMFNRYMIISPSLWWGDGLLLKDAAKLLAQNLKQPVEVYVAAPNKHEDLKMYRAAKDFYASLKGNSRIRSFFDYMPNELHSTVIHQAVYNGFKYFYPKTAYSKE